MYSVQLISRFGFFLECFINVNANEVHKRKD